MYLKYEGCKEVPPKYQSYLCSEQPVVLMWLPELLALTCTAGQYSSAEFLGNKICALFHGQHKTVSEKCSCDSG